MDSTSEAIMLCGGPSIRDVPANQISECMQRGVHVMSVNFKPVEAGLPMHSNISADGTWLLGNREPKPGMNDYIAKWAEVVMTNPNVEIWRRHQFRRTNAWRGANVTLEDLPNAHFYRGVMTPVRVVPDDFLGQPHTWFGEIPEVGSVKKSEVDVSCRCSMLPAFKILWGKGVRRVYLAACDMGNGKGRSQYWIQLARILENLNVQFKRHGLEVIQTHRGRVGAEIFTRGDLPA